MRLGVVKQQPGERLSYSVSYEKALVSPDVLSGASAEVDPAGELLVDAIAYTDTAVQFWAAGGVSGTRYKITLTVSTTEGRVFEDELVFVVREI